MTLVYSIIIVAFTYVVVHFLQRSDHKWIKFILDWFPAILFAYVVPAICTHLFGLSLSDVVIHEWSKSIVIPLAILTVMSALSFKQLKIIGLKPIVLFVFGSLIIATIPILYIWISKSIYPEVFRIVVNEGYWQGMLTMVGSWIGGSTSQLVLKEVAECPENLFIVILVMDNVLVNIWTILMFQVIKRSDDWNLKLGINDTVPDFVDDHLVLTEQNAKGTICTALVCISIVILTFALINNFLVNILLLSVVGLVLGNSISWWNHTLVLKIGGVLIILVMAILGLKLSFTNFSLPIEVIIFSIIWLISHFVGMVGLAYLLNIHTAWIPIGSMANVGGISTAPAVTAAYNEEWMPHAIILAILSMVSGTTWGLITIWLFNTFFLG